MFCLLFTPVLYIATLNGLQTYFNKQYLQKIENVFIGDTSYLLDGRKSIEEQISENIYTFLKTDWKIHHIGFDLKILVTTKKGKVVYPTFINSDSFTENFQENYDMGKIAKQNYDILHSGLNVDVELDLNHGSKFANLILFLYLSITIVIFLVFYKAGTSKAMHDKIAKKALFDKLKKEEQIHRQMIEDVKKERQGLFENIKALNAKYQKDKKKLEINEEEMFEEIISLETQLNSSIELKQKKEEEIKELKSKIKQHERRKSSRSQRNEFDFNSKRFNALYKNIDMHRKAMTGLLNLNEDQQIKAEECIHQMDIDLDKVTIKRKVFSGKKHKTACLEVLFAYNGRLYFRKHENNRIQVLVIGTKNTQAKDMDFLHKL